MSIVPLRKVTVFGLPREKTDILGELQNLGCLHLSPLAKREITAEIEAPSQSQDAKRALQYLLETPRKRRQLHHAAAFDIIAVIAETLENKAKLKRLGDYRDFLVTRIGELSPWGDFVLPPEGEMGGQRLWFYIVPVAHLREMEGTPRPWQVVHLTNKVAYVVVVSQDEPPADSYPVPRTHTGAKSLSELREELDMTEIEIEEAWVQRQFLTRHIHLMRRDMNIADDRSALMAAHGQTFDDDSVFAVQGWVAKRDAGRVTGFAERRGLALLIEEPKPGETPPTLLDNVETLSGGEDVASFYQTPNYWEWDPSPVVFFSFALFFAMILSDAGYATVLLLPVLAFWRRLGGVRTGRRLRTLALVMTGGAVVWGVMVGSYFGVAPTPGSFPAALAVVDFGDFDMMMRISITIGVIHVAIANGVVAVRRWGQTQAWARLGWIGVLFGGLAVWMGGEGSRAAAVGMVAAVAGLAAIFAFSSDRPVTGWRSVVWRALDGLLALTNVTKMFGDVLSYLRLFALGLAGASLALTFNDLATQVMESMHGVGLFFGLLILVAGHILNLGLSIMSGVVHGLRLNFIEFYNWGLSDEGYPFKPFERKEVRS